MKKLVIACFVLAASLSASAEEVKLLETSLRGVDSYRAFVDTRFYIDQDSREGYAQVLVTEEREVFPDYWDGTPWPRRGGGWFPGDFRRNRSILVTVFEETIKIEGLNLVGDKVVYYGEEGEVDCGKMGKSRVFKAPTLYLSGNCSLSGKLSPMGARRALRVTFKTN